MADLIEKLITDVAHAVIAAADHMTDLDQAIGDGDHGLNMKRGMEAVLADLPRLVGKPPGEVLKASGMQLVMKVGGASGPLFGTLAMELGKDLPASPSRSDLNAAFAGAVAAVAARGKSEAGQKTMLDVLIPVEKALAAGQNAAGIKAVALAAAAATIPMKATRGRASFLGDRSIGHMDPGSYSSALIISTICDALGG
jgi:phosphoenolpyruvate---glycerone phosphotransferase subunit DhaL